jgi:hypothetical protein
VQCPVHRQPTNENARPFAGNVFDLNLIAAGFLEKLALAADRLYGRIRHFVTKPRQFRGRSPGV